MEVGGYFWATNDSRHTLDISYTSDSCVRSWHELPLRGAKMHKTEVIDYYE